MASKDSISLNEAAERLGVHYMTAYRYVRTGRLAGHREGGQWCIDPADLKALQDSPEQGKPGRAPKGRRSWPKRFETQLLSGDEAGAWTVVQDAMAAGVEPTDFIETIYVPAMRSVGDRWELGEVSVAQEHQASAIGLRVLGRMGPQFSRRGRKRGHIVIGTAPGERHSMPSAILADLLRAQHYLVSDLGADVPIESFVSYAKQAPDLVAVGVGATWTGGTEAMPELIAELKRSVSVPVFAGGAAVPSAELAAEFGADLWSGQGSDLQWCAQIPKLAAKD